jgi:hypothetical protein
MNKILAKRYDFYDFSKIVGFPNPLPSRDEWEGILPTFKGEDWEVSAEHLLDFHEFICECHIVHEDVKIKLFKFSLKGASLDWCRSLPTTSVISLKFFHDAFNLFCKDDFLADVLFPECCHEFNLLDKDSNSQGEYAAIGDTSLLTDILRIFTMLTII